MNETSAGTEGTDSGTGKPDVAYDPDRLGEPGQPGVPMDNQSPSDASADDANVTEKGWGADLKVPEKED